jgi:hypothetical protein
MSSIQSPTNSIVLQKASLDSNVVETENAPDSLESRTSEVALLALDLLQHEPLLVSLRGFSSLSLARKKGEGEAVSEDPTSDRESLTSIFTVANNVESELAVSESSAKSEQAPTPW